MSFFVAIQWKYQNCQLTSAHLKFDRPQHALDKYLLLGLVCVERFYVGAYKVSENP